MWLRALDVKLLRELSRLRGQIATIAIVLAGGIVCFVSLRGTYASLATAQAAYYDRYRFAHVFATAERVPERVARKLEQLPGVDSVQTRVAKEVTVPIDGMALPAYGRLLSLPASGKPATNALYLRKGRFPSAERDDEIVLIESFAEAHGLEPGHRVPVVVNGKRRSFRIVGIALSPEFVYSVRPGAMVDDPKRHAVLWMERAALASAFELGGAFNDVSLRLAPDASEQAVRVAVDRLLAPYGGLGAIGRKEQISNRILTQELSQLGVLSTMVPAIFLGVTGFLVNLVLGRLIRLQRSEIATLKAIGYSDGEVGRHYLGLAIIVLVPGSAVGLAAGFALGRRVLGLYATSFRFPDLVFQMPFSLVATAVLVSALAALTGAYGAVRAAVRLPPAEAMQPPAPAHYRQSILERFGLGQVIGTSAMMVVRELARRPLRTLFSSLGIAGAVSLLILSHFGLDSLLSYFDNTFLREQRQDLAVTFARPVPPSVVGELGRLPGVLRAEGLRLAPVRVTFGHRSRDSVMMGLPEESTLRRLVTRGGSEVSVPDDGVVLTKTLGDVLGIRVGDRPAFEVREGERRTIYPVVVGFVDESIGMSSYLRAGALAKLEGDLGAVSTVMLAVDPLHIDEIEADLRRSPHILDVSDASHDMERLLELNQSIMNVWTAISIVLSAGIVFGVVYNNARIALAARSRELASLRVLGFTRREISGILLGSQIVEVALAVPVGLWLGAVWAEQFMQTVDQETFRWAVHIAPSTYLLSVTVTVLAAAASALWVRRSLDTLDLVSVLKARE
ncbi:MAG TPA: FtsX-like permease family protein [Polyangiaceae bacterium]|nr:FtsX-like permease family protein [Polyangiaceae bacterium]